MQRSPVSLLAVVAVALVAALAGGAMGAALYARTDDPARPAETHAQVPARGTSPAAVQSGSVGDVYQRANPGVVEITVAAGRSGDDTPFQQQERRSLGSGWIYDGEGHVVTNQHVVANGRNVAVTFSNGDSYDARVVGTDPSTDLAVIEVDAPAELLRPLPVGDSATLSVGDPVVAIGSPFGLEGTVTAGIVSALNRQMQAPNNFTINDSIQTDAAINHGNSGGPLLNMQGEVVGVNAQIRSDGGGNEGVGFAIPSATVQTIVPQLIERGQVRHAYLGVTVVEIPATAAEELGVPAGVAVASVRDGGPAEDADLRAGADEREVNGSMYPTGGDVITAIDGRPVRTTRELQQAIDEKRPGETVMLTVARGGDTREVEVELAERPANAGR